MGAIADPAIRIDPVDVAHGSAGGWRTTWRVSNEDPEPIRVVAANAPHSKLRGATSLTVEVARGGSATFPLVVVVEGSAGDEIENAFLILLVEARAARWRVLARLRVRLEADGRPSPRVEAVTVQRVGFSGEL